MRDNEDSREGAGLSASGLMQCPRFEVLKKTYPYCEDPDDYYPRFRGTILHGGIEQFSLNQEGVISEVRYFRELDGVRISGKMDEVLPDYMGVGKLTDFKSGGRRKLHPTMEVTPDHAAQVNVYRWILEGNTIPIGLLSIRYISDTTMQEVPVPLWSMEETEEFISEYLRKQEQFALPPILPSSYTVSRRTKETTEVRHWRCGFCPLRIECDALPSEGIT